MYCHGTGPSYFRAAAKVDSDKLRSYPVSYAVRDLDPVCWLIAWLNPARNC
jgi:hypothetical protein